MGLRIYACVAAAAALGMAAAQAHHSFAAVFDGDKALTLTGKVTSVEWTNPHIHFSIEVDGGTGEASVWRFEGYPPNMLVRQGWRRDQTMKPGDMITVVGWEARDEPNLGAARQVTFADGRTLMAGPPAGTGGR